MSNACLFIGFNRPAPGREAEAWKTFEASLAAIEGFKKEGWCDSYEVIGLTPHFGTTNSFVLLQGERAKLDELRRTDKFERFSMTLARMFDGYGVVPGVTLEGLRKVRERASDLFA